MNEHHKDYHDNCMAKKPTYEEFEKISESLRDHHAWHYFQMLPAVDAMGGWANFRHWVTKHAKNYFDSCTELKNKIAELETELEKVKKDSREAVSTTWRFIGAYKKENAVPIKGALKSAEYHLRKVDYIFDEEEA